MRTFVLIACALVGWGLLLPSVSGRVRADDATPATTVPTSGPTVPTLTPLPEATGVATVTEERSTPAATVVATLAAAPTSTAVPEVSPTLPAAPGSSGPNETPTPLAVPLPAATAPPASTYWPTPAQLRQDARLRWGRGIPAAVRRWAFLIVPAAHRYGLDPNLLAAVMTMESGGDPLALSPADARGLMQILHGPWDPQTNVDEGAHMLADLYAQFGDWRLALAAYNAGPAAVTTYGGIPPYRETRDYVIVVTYLWDLFSHHRLSLHRRQQYRATLRDLQRFADQRQKVTRLANVAHIAPPPAARCSIRLCGANAILPPLRAGDPFWPLGGSPDPLQYVAPPGSQ